MSCEIIYAISSIIAIDIALYVEVKLIRNFKKLIVKKNNNDIFLHHICLPNQFYQFSKDSLINFIIK